MYTHVLNIYNGNGGIKERKVEVGSSNKKWHVNISAKTETILTEEVQSG